MAARGWMMKPSSTPTTPQVLDNGFGQGGFGYWLSSPLLDVHDNVAAGAFRFEAYSYWLFGKQLALRPINGADLSYLQGVEGLSAAVLNDQTFNTGYQPIVSNHDNIADTALGTGMVVSYSNSPCWTVEQFTANIRGLLDEGFYFFYSATGVTAGR